MLKTVYLLNVKRKQQLHPKKMCIIKIGNHYLMMNIKWEQQVH